MSEIALEGVTKRFGGTVAVSDVDLVVRDGELLVLVGPSGCGKTTLLRIVAGLEHPTTGDVYVDGERVTDVPARKRDLALVFQDFALFPHMNVRENVSFNLRMSGGYDDVDARVERTAELLEIDDLLDRPIDELSGGQKQRVALGRAIAVEPKAFLFDEPLANLDAKLREQMQTEIARLQDRLAVTTVHVTHDQVEALTMGDRIAVVNDGRLQQVGPPEAVYHRPANLFVARFVGTPAMNLLEGRYAASAGAVRIADDVEVPVELDGDDGRPVTVGVRPEHLQLDAPDPAVEIGTATVSFVEFRGADVFVHLDPERVPELTARTGGDDPPSDADPVTVSVRPEHLHFFDTRDGVRLDPDVSADGTANDEDHAESPTRDPTEQ